MKTRYNRRYKNCQICKALIEPNRHANARLCWTCVRVMDRGPSAAMLYGLDVGKRLARMGEDE